MKSVSSSSQNEAAPEAKEPQKTNYKLLIFAITAYSTVSLSVVYFNFWVFTVGFKFPVFVSWIQQVVGLLMFLLGSYVARYFSTIRPIFPQPVIRRETIVKVLPLTVSFVLMVGLANICLQKTLISTYQVARSLTLLFVMGLSYIILKQTEKYISMFACALMVIGFIIGSLDPSTLTFMGLLTGGLSSLCQAFYNVFIKKSLGYVQDNNQLLLFYNVLISSVVFIPMVLVSEDLSVFSQAFGFDTETRPRLPTIWGAMLLSGVLGTLLNMTTYLTVKVTSPLTFNIVGFSKSLVQSVGGIIFLGDKVTVASITGLLFCLTGSAVYTKAKYDDQKTPKVGYEAAREQQEIAEDDKEELFAADNESNELKNRSRDSRDSKDSSPSRIMSSQMIVRRVSDQDFIGAQEIDTQI